MFRITKYDISAKVHLLSNVAALLNVTKQHGWLINTKSTIDLFGEKEKYKFK